MRESKSELASLADPRHTAVLVVDVQEQFAGMSLYPPVADVLPRVRRFVDIARVVGAMIVCIQEIIPTGMDFAPGFAPQPGDVYLRKPRYSAFFGTSLETILRGRGIRTVIVAGLTTDVCVSSTARDASQNDFATITLRDCTAEQTQARYESSLATLATVFGMVCDSTEIIAAWRTLRVEDAE